jgi:CBS domain-containing protein
MRKTIRDVMQDRPITVKPEMPLHTAVELLIEHNISGLPVVDDEGLIVGVLADRDLVSVFYKPEADTVESVMTRNPETISVDAPLVDVFDYLMSNDFRRVLIHDRKKLVGLVSRADIMPPLLDVLLDRTRARPAER